MCCKRRKLTHAEKAARRFDEYVGSLFLGVLASIVVLGLSAAVVAKAAGNAAMIWHIALSIITGIVMIMLLVRADKDFGVQQKIPTLTSIPKGTYTILFFFLLLWISAFVAFLADWPTDSNGFDFTNSKRKKRGFGDFVGASTNATDGLAWGIISLDAVFIISSFLLFTISVYS
ncbi:hypothetical protein F5882DRAFT_443457 [Hyaloscypha sp. PMI_1271]|nr:hypothetical protein F5882DRAFT_443457 [Hyaloscypha sp. PMI_1271]